MKKQIRLEYSVENDCVSVVEDLTDNDESGIPVEVMHKDDDCVFLYCMDTDTTLYADIERVRPSHLLMAISILTDLPTDVLNPDMVEVKSDGLMLDGKFMSHEHLFALVNGSSLNSLKIMGLGDW